MTLTWLYSDAQQLNIQAILSRVTHYRNIWNRSRKCSPCVAPKKGEFKSWNLLDQSWRCIKANVLCIFEMLKLLIVSLLVKCWMNLSGKNKTNIRNLAILSNVDSYALTFYILLPRTAPLKSTGSKNVPASALLFFLLLPKYNIAKYCILGRRAFYILQNIIS